MDDALHQRTVDDVFSALGGPAKFARGVSACGVPYDVKVTPSGAGEMKRRQSIPVPYWIPLIEFARNKGVAWLTYEALTFIHAPKPQANLPKAENVDG